MGAFDKWRVKCNTDNKYEYWWLPEGSAAPTTCPVQTSHPIDSAATALVETVGEHDVQITHTIGGPKTDVDGLYVCAGANGQGHADYVVPEAFHIGKTHVQWKDAQAHDYGWLAVIHPSSIGTLPVPANSGQRIVDVGVLADAYDPANGAAYIEFWNADGSLILEVVKIASRSGSMITVDRDIVLNHIVGEKIKARYDGFAPVRGPKGLDGGFRLLGSGSTMVDNTTTMTEAIPAGLLLCVRLICSGDPGLRHLVMNFIFRKPMEPA